MKRKMVKVRTRARTMSGYPGGRTMTLDPRTAEEWINRGWAEAIVDPADPDKKPQELPYKRRSTTMDVTP